MLLKEREINRKHIYYNGYLVVVCNIEFQSPKTKSTATHQVSYLTIIKKEHYFPKLFQN